MERRFSTRDGGLTARMAVAVGGVAVVYGGLVAMLLGALYDAIAQADVGLALGAVMFLVAIPLLLRKHHRELAENVLRLTRAKPDPRGDAFVEAAARLAAAADIAPAPDVLVAPSNVPNALVVPTGGKPLIILTAELLDRLEPGEVEAVLAHEISHLANRDAEVMTFVSGPALAFSGLWHDGGRGPFAAAMFSPLWLYSLLLMRAVSRYREYTADRGAALLTAPAQLMSALTKIHDVAPTGDLRGGRPVSALCIRGFSKPWVPLLRDHPPVARRLARLAEMARIQGEPVGP